MDHDDRPRWTGTEDEYNEFIDGLRSELHDMLGFCVGDEIKHKIQSVLTARLMEQADIGNIAFDEDQWEVSASIDDDDPTRLNFAITRKRDYPC